MQGLGVRSQLEQKIEEEFSGSRVKYALHLLADPLLPVRGHGLIELTTLVENKDNEAVTSVRKIITIFKVGSMNCVVLI